MMLKWLIDLFCPPRFSLEVAFGVENGPIRSAQCVCGDGTPEHCSRALDGPGAVTACHSVTSSSVSHPTLKQS
jgi:hypothetical protein